MKFYPDDGSSVHISKTLLQNVRLDGIMTHVTIRVTYLTALRRFLLLLFKLQMRFYPVAVYNNKTQHTNNTPQSKKTLKNYNSVACTPQAIPTERPPLVGEVSANFCG
jgi:hypothetical protein